MTVNLRRVRTQRRDLLRQLGEELRRLREDAGLSQRLVARAAGISPSYLSYLEAGVREPSVETLLRLGAVLGADLSVRYFPTTGPAVRDHVQLAMGEGLLPITERRWRRHLEVAVYRPVRGVIDLVLEDRLAAVTVATELQGQLRRVEQQVRWANQKADALAATPGQASRTVSRLLVLRDSQSVRAVVAASAATLGIAYPARTEEAVAALAGETPWPGAAVVWMHLDRGIATLRHAPPRGVPLGR